MKWMMISALTLIPVVLSAQEVIQGAAGIEFVKIGEGSFRYGKYDPVVHEKDAQSVKLAKAAAMPGFDVNIAMPFYIGKYEVTQRQWREVMGANPSFFKGDDLPVENITWEMAQSFLKKLNELDSIAHYRLPSEFEWEYAARSGNNDDISWEEIRVQAQIGTKRTMDVGGKKPNAWGLYDMLGNVWEWVEDGYNDRMFADPLPPVKSYQHVLKGASFTGDVKNATYMTHAAGPGNGWDVGLRVVREEKALKKEVKRSHRNIRQKTKVPGWHISRTTHQGTTPEIQYKNGVITLSQCPFGQGGVLLTDKKYRDFELSMEVKIDSFCNGGIFLRSSESGQAYQVELSEPGGTGSLFGEMMGISLPAEAKGMAEVWKPGQWNHFRVRMTGSVPTVSLWINDKLMWEVTQPVNDFTAAATEGMIGLQVHWSSPYSPSARAFDMSGSWRPAGKHQFRNIRIVSLDK